MRVRVWLRSRWVAFAAVSIALLACGHLAYQVQATPGQNKVKYQGIKGLVTDGQGRAVVGAKVYFVESTLVGTASMKPAEVLAGTTESYDEPLEDIVNNAEKAKTLPVSTTDKNGRFRAQKLKRDSSYFPFVKLADTDTDHLPGGDVSREAFSPKVLGRSSLTIKISWKTPDDATYIGTTACYGCHPFYGNKKHAHSLALQIPGARTANQDITYHPNADDGLNAFVSTTDYKKGKKLFLQNADTSAKNFEIFEDAAGEDKMGTNGKVYFNAYLWKDSTTNEYKITLVNLVNTSDKNSPMTVVVGLTKGGLMGKQYFLASLPGRKGHYAILGFQGFSGASKGTNFNYDRSRHAFIDSGMSKFIDVGADKKFATADDKLTTPAALTATGSPNNWDSTTCAGCHYTGFQSYTDATTGEVLGHAVPDENGIDVTGDGVKTEINVGCERCHGPGSRHRDEVLKAGATTTESSKSKVKAKASAPDQYKGKYIVNPGLLCNDRASLICGRCHGGGSITNPDNFPPAGISRADYLQNYVSAASKGPALSNFWDDAIHAKKGENYANWLTSKHSHNQRYLVACDDCHTPHQRYGYEASLRDDPEDPNSTLCQRCHTVDINEHAKEKTGNAMTGGSGACVECHMAKTAVAGAGRPGLILGTPTGLSSDANIIYWENNGASHVFDVPHKFALGTAGKTPGNAMPVPYTNSCGPCHDASKLQYQQAN